MEQRSGTADIKVSRVYDAFSGGIPDSNNNISINGLYFLTTDRADFPKVVGGLRRLLTKDDANHFITAAQVS